MNSAKKKIQFSLLGLAGVAGLWLIACKKYEDPAKPDIILTNHYCNDPIAANYNHGFPGIPDNSVCVYATDFFEGAWIWVDSIYDADMNFQQRQTRNLSFSPLSLNEDSLRTRLTVAGFCDNNTILKIRANKYASALTDTLVAGTNGGQIFCNTTDTVSGYFKRTNDTLTQSMNIILTENKPSGVFYHKGLAVKQ